MRWVTCCMPHDPGKFMVATVDQMSVTGAAQTARTNADQNPAIPTTRRRTRSRRKVALGVPEMAHMAATNLELMTALRGKGVRPEVDVRAGQPREVVAEVWTAMRHGRDVPRGLAAVYLRRHAQHGHRQQAAQEVSRQGHPSDGRTDRRPVAHLRRPAPVAGLAISEPMRRHGSWRSTRTMVARSSESSRSKPVSSRTRRNRWSSVLGWM